MSTSSGNLNSFDAIRIIVTNMFGAGILTLSNSFELAGYIGGTLLLFISCLLTFTTGYFLYIATDSYETVPVNSSEEESPIKKETTYGDLLGRIKIVSKALNLINALICYASTLAYFIFIVEYIHTFFLPHAEGNQYFDSKKGGYLRPLISAIMGILFFLVSILIRSVKKLSKICYATLVGVFCVFVMNLSLGFFAVNSSLSISAFGKNRFAEAIPAFVFATCCQISIVPVFTKLKNKSKRNAIKILAFSSLIAFVVYFISGFFGYYVIRELGNKDFLEIMFDKQSYYLKSMTDYSDGIYSTAISVSIIFIFGLFGSYSCQNFMGRDNLMELINGSTHTTMPIRVILSFVHNTCLAIIAAYNVPAGFVISLIGSFCMPIVAFLIPSYLYFEENYVNKYYHNLIVPSIVFLIGILIFGYSSTECILNFRASRVTLDSTGNITELFSNSSKLFNTTQISNMTVTGATLNP